MIEYKINQAYDVSANLLRNYYILFLWHFYRENGIQVRFQFGASRQAGRRPLIYHQIGCQILIYFVLCVANQQRLRTTALAYLCPICQSFITVIHKLTVQTLFLAYQYKLSTNCIPLKQLQNGIGNGKLVLTCTAFHRCEFSCVQ